MHNPANTQAATCALATCRTTVSHARQHRAAQRGGSQAATQKTEHRLQKERKTPRGDTTDSTECRKAAAARRALGRPESIDVTIGKVSGTHSGSSIRSDQRTDPENLTRELETNIERQGTGPCNCTLQQVKVWARTPARAARRAQRNDRGRGCAWRRWWTSRGLRPGAARPSRPPAPSLGRCRRARDSLSPCMRSSLGFRLEKGVSQRPESGRPWAAAA